MASTLLEQTRASHEEMELLERLIVRDFHTEAKSHKERLYQNHRVRAKLDQMQTLATRLAQVYHDDDGARKEEIAALRGENMYSTFYDRLKEVRDYHRRHPTLDVTEAENHEDRLKEQPRVEFSGEEALGRFLDLHEHHNRFLNSKFGRQVEYAEYVSSLTAFDQVPRQQRLARAYREYLSGLLAYLESFYERSQPLSSLAKAYKGLEEETRSACEVGGLSGWEDRGVRQAAPEVSSQIDLEAFESVDELEMLGAERLKELLAALGLKCGGTPRQRAARLMLTKHTPLEQLDRKLFAKGTIPQSRGGEMARQQEAAWETVLLEAKLGRLCSVLGNVLDDTKSNVEKKAARTYEELQAEQEEADLEGMVTDSDEEDEFVYNPLKLPLGWDGKPIPYWLYKLHGLNQEFKCEICGNASYWGRRAFERHFKEYRHQNGMRALGIPNNKNFYEVTKIADAQALWKNMQEREKGGFRAEMEEEYEDGQGNVYNKKTYEDLKRQGLID
ncbi:hypothetical protein WJX72_006646 [[Myrmecia] bisecta]|uniref:Matrin-type domain-containing protein n=1 Tax=[Myrmecia] bisecta TaxID=41462 RepID=A0AAW1PXF9_9CHLO